jgi:hypothetical protein
MRRLLLASFVLALGCSCGESSERAAPAASPSPSVTPPAPPEPEAPAAPAPPPLGTTRDLAGLRVTPNEDGTIRIEGTDRWGGDVSATYESVEFLAPALAVYERSLSEEQVAGLRALVDELRGGAAPPAGAPGGGPPAGEAPAEVVAPEEPGAPAAAASEP